MTALPRHNRSYGPIPKSLQSVLSTSKLQAVDVGAAGGMPAHWSPYKAVLDIDAFEPDVAEFHRLSARREEAIRWHPFALAGQSGTRDFYELRRPTGSSLLPPNPEVLGCYASPSYYDVKTTRRIDCLSLGDFLRSIGRSPQLLKLDTQGTELEILQSLDPSQLASVLAVEVEVEFLELYAGQPLFVDVHRFMIGSGFQLADLRTHRAYRTDGREERAYLRRVLKIGVGKPTLSAQLVAGDALYLRTGDPECVFASPLQMARSLIVNQIYRYYDLNLWLLDQPLARRVLPSREREQLTREVARSAPRARLFERSDRAFEILRSLEKRFLGRSYEYQAFWTRREWPDQ